MTFSPKTYLTKPQYQQIADLFALGKIQKIVKIKKGFESAKVIITTSKGRFVVACHQLTSRVELIKKTKKSLLWEIKLTNSLKNLPVPHFLTSKNNKMIEDCNDSYITIYKFLPGNHPKSINPAKAYKLGKLLGNFHKQGKKFKKVCKDRRKFYDLTPGVIKKMSAVAKKQKNSTLKSKVDEIKRRIEQNQLPKNLPIGPIHVDIKPENELFIKDKLTGILDFGISYHGPYLIDIAKTIIWNCTKDNKIDDLLLNQFLKGYNIYRKLDFNESTNLKKSILYGIYASIFVDLYQVPLNRATKEFCLYMIKGWLPIADWLKNKNSLLG